MLSYFGAMNMTENRRKQFFKGREKEGERWKRNEYSAKEKKKKKFSQTSTTDLLLDVDFLAFDIERKNTW